ncbi:fluoride efflux transporter FluC [Mangrovibacillus cuniculi]|uniref:Fluoride-specific ion channel n=1 Tax=Mangrovibacillus cuniculi TaxID=2593652 RepID=A0A7S8CA19_9BACI|nr:CrcB family protein [Mangrovibacillus cuniculi]QPC46169.1 CrcB family protein [Mangrovibacillus cuniculi]
MIFIIATGGAIGAFIRHVIVTKLTMDVLNIKIGLLLVNFIGSALFGMLSYMDNSTITSLFVGTAICGSLTTFSSLIMEMVHFLEERKYVVAIYICTVHLIGSFVFYLGGKQLAVILIQ